MFRKKQKPSENKRSVTPQPRAPVFSYYASRAQSQPARNKHGSGGKARGRMSLQFPGLRKIISVVPSLIAGAALIASVVYISTLDATPIIQIVSSSSNHQGLVEDGSKYEDEFRDTLADSPLNRSKLFIDTDKIARELTARFPELGEVSVVLPLVGRQPIFKIRPAEPAIVLDTLEGGPYIVDTNGRVLADIRETNDGIVNKQLPVVRDESGLPSEPGRVVMTVETIVFIKSVVEQLEQSGMKLKSIVLPQTSVGEVDIHPKDKPYFVKFDTKNGEGRKQAGTFLAVKGHLEHAGITPSSYIDVRVPEKAFYK